MNTSICWTILVVGVFALQNPTVSHAADADRREAYRSVQIRSYLDGKPRALAGFQSDAVRLMPQYQQTILGKANAMAYYRAFLERFTVRSYTRTELDVLDLGSRVVETGQFTMVLAAKSTGQSHELAGKYFDVWTKDAAGALALITASWNYDEPAKIANDLRFPQVPSLIFAHQPRVPIKGGASFELAALERLHESAVIQRDGAVWALLSADDAIMLANHGPVVRGRVAIDAYYDAHAKVLPVFEKLDIRTESIEDLGEHVIEYGGHIAIFRAGDYAGVNTGKNIRVWRRGTNGQLRIFRSISMYD